MSRSETIKRLWAEGVYKTPKKCPTCSCWLGKNHSCEEIKKKQREAKLNNPVRYWQGKKRPESSEVMKRNHKEGKIKQEKGEKNHNWTGGTSNWYRKEARRIMSEKLERPLKPSEIVHHIDGDYKNNKVSNLVITNRKEHAKEHSDRGDLPAMMKGNPTQ